MRLREFVKSRGRGSLSEIQRQTGFAYSTIHRIYRGRPASYTTAQAICLATNGLVSIAELCAPQGSAQAPDSGDSGGSGDGGG